MEGIKHYTHDGEKLIEEATEKTENTLSFMGLKDEYVMKGYYKIDKTVGDTYNVELDEKGIAIERLRTSDWRVTRHRDEKELGGDTSMTEDDYTKLLEKRKKWRDTLNS